MLCVASRVYVCKLQLFGACDCAPTTTGTASTLASGLSSASVRFVPAAAGLVDGVPPVWIIKIKWQR